MQHFRQSALAGLAVLLCGVMIRMPSNPSEPPSSSLFSRTTVPPHVATTLRNSCADCHSNRTVWPWYVHVPIVSILLVGDVNDARKHFNLSDWTKVQQRGPEETAAAFSGICENLISGAMPKPSYLWMHPEARVSKAQISEVCEWTDKEQMTVLRQSAAILNTTH